MMIEKKSFTSKDLGWVFDDSHVDEIHEKIATGEFKTAEELISYLKSKHNLD